MAITPEHYNRMYRILTRGNPVIMASFAYHAANAAARIPRKPCGSGDVAERRVV
jgi:hypothetical protein